MKNLSVRTKITFWFSSVLFLIVALMLIIIFTISNLVLQKSVKDGLVLAVDSNVDEVEYLNDRSDAVSDGDNDQYIQYGDGVLEIDDDYLDIVNGSETSLFNANGELVYGAVHPAADPVILPASDGIVQRVTYEKITYYVYDRILESNNLQGLWLRGIVSEAHGAEQMGTIYKWSAFLFPVLLFSAIMGGYAITGRMLRPIEDIRLAAEDIRMSSDLKKRINIGGGDDELHMLANTFNSMFERLEEQFEAEKQFTSDASHELRTPIAVISAQCEYTLEKKRDAEEYEEALELIKKQNKKLSSLVEEMLEFTRLEQRTDTNDFQKMCYSSAVRSVCESMQLIKNKGITLSYNIEKGIYVNGNAQMLSRLCENLISNAYKYGISDGYIKVSLDYDGEYAILAVTDNGIGIDDSNKENVFRRFWQADASRNAGGAGLGLPISAQIAKCHGGALTVSDNPDGGSIFTFTIAAEQEKNSL